MPGYDIATSTHPPPSQRRRLCCLQRRCSPSAPSPSVLRFMSLLPLWLLLPLGRCSLNGLSSLLSTFLAAPRAFLGGGSSSPSCSASPPSTTSSAAPANCPHLAPSKQHISQKAEHIVSIFEVYRGATPAYHKTSPNTAYLQSILSILRGCWLYIYCRHILSISRSVFSI